MSPKYCEGCSLKLTLWRRKTQCPLCKAWFCDSCSPFGFSSGFLTSSVRENLNCYRCRIITMKPISKEALMQLKIRDLKNFLIQQRISVRHCTGLVETLLTDFLNLFIEKTDLVNLIMKSLNFSTEKSNVYTFENDGIRVHGFGDYEDLGIRVQPSSSAVDNLSSELCNNLQENTEDEILQSSSHENQNTIVSLQNNLLSDYQTRFLSSTENSIQNSSSPHSNVSLQEVIPINCVESVQSSPSSVYKSLTRIPSLSSFDSLSQLEQLDVRTCKELLSKYRVNYRGCCEKEDLLNKLRSLWIAQTSENDKLTDEQLCCICMQAAKDCVFLECGHMCTCTTCGKQMNECPICRQFVVRVVHVFKA